MDPNHVKALEARAVVYMQKDQIDLAEEDLKRALEIEPKNPRITIDLDRFTTEEKTWIKLLSFLPRQ